MNTLILFEETGLSESFHCQNNIKRIFPMQWIICFTFFIDCHEELFFMPDFCFTWYFLKLVHPFPNTFHSLQSTIYKQTIRCDCSPIRFLGIVGRQRETCTLDICSSNAFTFFCCIWIPAILFRKKIVLIFFASILFHDFCAESWKGNENKCFKIISYFQLVFFFFLFFHSCPLVHFILIPSLLFSFLRKCTVKL